MLSTDKQTNRQPDKLTNQRYQKHNLLCQGGNNYIATGQNAFVHAEHICLLPTIVKYGIPAAKVL